MILSWIDQGNLRNRMYEQAQRIEILETALDDCARISKDPLIQRIVQRTLNQSN